MIKSSLRLLYRQKMLALSDEEHLEKSKAIANNFIASFNLFTISALHLFLPIIKNKEINTWLIIEEVDRINPAVKIIISKSDFKTYEMTSHLYTKDVTMQEGRFGIIEPASLELFNEKEIDIILLPLLAFDEKGFRVGYGKGFYDRFILKCRVDVIKIGLSLFPPVAKITDTNSHDMRLNYCITPDKIIKFD